MARTILARSARLLAAVLVSLGLVAAAALPAHAWVGSASAARPGGVRLGAVSVMDLFSGYTPLLTVAAAGPTVSRSPATTGAQDVVAVMVVQKWNGSWVTVLNRPSIVRIPAGVTTVRVPNLAAQPTTGKGYYRVVWGFTWMRAASTTTLGATVVVPDRVTDHACVTRLRPCASYAGYVQVGRLYMVGGGW